MMRAVRSPFTLLSSVLSAAFFLALFAMLVSSSAASVGCNEVTVHDAPDASPNCAAPVLEYPCAPLDAGSAGCSGNLNSQATLGRPVTLDGSFPVGCTVIVNDPTPDSDNQCDQTGTCDCNALDGGAYGWTCYN
jgi:hypothetical protein